MKKRNNPGINKKRAGRQILSAFCAAVLLVCQILLATAPLAAMGAAVMTEDGSASVGQQWLTEDIHEYAPEGEDTGEELLKQDGFSESSAASSDRLEYAEQETSEEPADSSMADPESSDYENMPAADEDLNVESGTEDKLPAEEPGGKTTAGETSADEMSSDEMSSGEMPSDAMPSDGTSAEEDESGKSSAYETDEDSGDSQEAFADDTAEAVPDDTVPAGPSCEDPVTEDDVAGHFLPGEAAGEGTDSIDAGSIYEIIEVDEEPETVIPVKNGSENTDNDDIFTGYVCRELEVDEGFLEAVPETEDPEDRTNREGKDAEEDDARTAPDQESVSSPALRSYYASTRLTGYTRILYDRLLDVIRQISAGERAETTIEFSVEDLELDGLSWSAEDLGVEAITALDDEGKRYITSEAKTALKEMIGISYASANKALLADCPYDLYWYDKTASSKSTWFAYTAKSSSGEWRIKPSPSSYYTVYMPVSADYSADGTAGTYYVNTSIGSSVTEAYNNARAIVEQYSDLTDYRKLDAYRQEICSRTSYNYTAMREEADYGDPWQLIYALDDDFTNQVVCEGYSKAFQYLCDLSSFNSIFQECISVTGKLGSEGHMWNVVSLRDGTNYLVDLTNCDSGMVGDRDGGRGLFLVGTGTADILKYYCTGNVTSGYKFNLSTSGPKYTYDQNAFSRFGGEILTLSEGKAVLEDADITLSIPEDGYVYDGTEKRPEVTVRSFNRTFTEGRDYTVEYFNNIASGENTAQVLVTALEDGRCLDSARVTFSIDKGVQNLSASDLDVVVQEQAVMSVDGAQGELTFTSADSSIAEVGTKDGTLRGVSPGTVKVAVSAAQTDNYNAARIEIDVTVRIRISAAEMAITISSENLVYDGTAKTPAVSIADGSGTKLTNGSDYTLDYSNNVNAGTNTGVVTITGTGAYTGTITEYFTIEKAPQSLSVRAHASSIAVGKGTLTYVTGAKGRITYTSSDPTVAGVSAGGTVTGKKTGKAVITIISAETENYLQTSQQITISVVPAATSTFKAFNRQLGILLTWKKVEGASSYDIYRGSTKIRTIQGGSAESFQDNSTLTNGSSYSYKIYARASSGVSTLYRSVVICRLARPSITSLYNPAPGKMLVTWARNARVTKYQVQYSLYSDFRSSATVNVMGASSLKTVIGGLSRNRIRYVRLRTCKTVGNATYTSMWSMTRNLKILK